MSVPAREEGSAPVEFVLVGALLTALFVGLLQVGFDLHVRNTLVSAATEGARYGANADRSPADGAARTRQLVAQALSARYAGDVDAGLVDEAGVPVVAVRIRTTLPLIAWWGSSRQLDVSGHALAEQP